MIAIDMTAELAPIFGAMVVLLALTSAAIAANAVGPDVANWFRHFTRRNKRPISRRGTILPARA